MNEFPPSFVKCCLNVNLAFLFNHHFSILKVRFVNYIICQLLFLSLIKLINVIYLENKSLYFLNKVYILLS